jgi:demethylmenaquinone methyltransferase/2-methoxy-6-polyprenyl-1,4-benzoquinol methylase
MMGEQSDVREQIVEIYRQRAGNYDLTANLYYFLGYPEWKYRRLTIERLQLSQGDTVVEIGCGTGLNFGLVQERIGPEGKLIGVDLTDAMLAQARERIERKGWDNVELVHQDASQFDFPQGIDGIYSTLALSLIPDAPDVILRSARALKNGGRWSLLDFEIPSKWPRWLVDAVMLIIRPFTPIEEWRSRKPWREIQTAMEAALGEARLEYYYMGTTYLMSGEAEISG